MKKQLIHLALPSILSLLYFAASPLYAQVYKTVDEYGNVTFSDTPSSDAEKVEIKSVNTQPGITPRPTKAPIAPMVKNPQIRVIESTATTPTSPPKERTTANQPQQREAASQSASVPKTPPKASKPALRIALPKAGTKIPSGKTSITLILLTAEPLQEGELLQASIDGKPVGEPTTTNNIALKLPSSKRGAISIGAVQIDSKGNTKATAQPVTVLISHP